MGVGGKTASPDFEAEVVELALGEPALDEGAGVDPGRGVALEVDLVPGLATLLAPEEVVEPDFVEGCRAGVGGQVPADRLGPVVGPDHHDGGVPPDVGADPAFEVLVPRKFRFSIGRDGVHVRSRHCHRKPDLGLLCPLEYPHE